MANYFIVLHELFIEEMFLCEILHTQKQTQKEHSNVHV